MCSKISNKCTYITVYDIKILLELISMDKLFIMYIIILSYMYIVRWYLCKYMFCSCVTLLLKEMEEKMYKASFQLYERIEKLNDQTAELAIKLKERDYR